MTGFVPRERLELAPNKEYWDKGRVPKLDRMVLVPLPEANARVAALRSGQVDWIEAPAPDAVPSLKAAGFALVTNLYPHNWTGTCRGPRARRGTTSACARPRTSPSTARA